MRFCGVDEAKDLADMAWEIWVDYYSGFLDRIMVEYVVRLAQSEDAIKQQIQDGYLYSYIMDGTEKAGYFSFLPEGDTIYISKFYLSKASRGKGLGSKAMDSILEEGRSMGMKIAYLRANKHNKLSLKFYERKGFVITEAILENIGEGFFLDDYRLEYYF